MNRESHFPLLPLCYPQLGQQHPGDRSTVLPSDPGAGRHADLHSGAPSSQWARARPTTQGSWASSTLQALAEAEPGCCSHRKGSTEDKQSQNPALRLVLAETNPVHWHCPIHRRRNSTLAELMGRHGIKASRALTCLRPHDQAQAEKHRLGSAIALYLRWRERQRLDRGALGRHAVAGVDEGKAGAGGILCDWGEGDLPLLLPLQHRGRRAKAHLCVRRDGDELPFAALAQVGDGVAVQAVLGHIGQGRCWLAGGLPHRAAAATAAAGGGFLWQVKLGQITPPVWVLHTRETVRSSPGKNAEQPTGADAEMNWEVK